MIYIIHYWSAHTSFDFCNLSWWQNSAAETTIFTKILHYTLSKLSLQYVTTIWCNNFSSQRVVCCHNRMLSVFWSLRFVFCITLCNGWTMNLIVGSLIHHLRLWKGNWVNFTLAKTPGTVTSNKEKKSANSRKQMHFIWFHFPFRTLLKWQKGFFNPVIPNQILAQWMDIFRIPHPVQIFNLKSCPILLWNPNPSFQMDTL